MAAVALLASAARAATLTVLTDERSLRNGSLYVYSDGSPQFLHIAPACCSKAYQSSTLAPDEFYGSGYYATDAGGPPGDSIFSVAFQTSELATYVLQGNVTGDIQNGSVQFSASNSGQTWFLDDPYFTLKVLLVPGETYHLYLQSANAGVAPWSGGWAFNFTAPEPGSAPLAALALSLLPLAAARAARPRAGR